MEFNSQNRASSAARPGVNPPARLDTPQPTMNISSQKNTRKKLSPKAIIGAIIALVVLIGGWYLFSSVFNSARIDSGKYQAVFLSNGQVYFGKLSDSMGEYMYLKDIYYVQANDVFADVSTILQESEDALNASEKLLQYAPDVDL